ncbi:MAG: S8 family serine peptidase, partial [Bacteroidota bacterium]
GIVKHRSRWLNGVTVRIPNNDSLIRQRIWNFPFVRLATPNGRVAGPPGAGLPKDKFVKELTVSVMQPGITNRTTSVYGFSGGQIRLHKGDYLHDRNFRGQGMRIAVFDAGFVNMPNMPVFDSLYLRNRIVDTYDFVDMDTGVYEFDSHGTYVMGCLAANIPGQLMGTAPEAQYMLYRSENNVGGSENPIEEDNWVAAAERADSAGADVFKSSLIYTTFDQPSMNHSWSDMDGNTARMTIASDWAAAKGILVVNSAGNYGGGPWYKIGAAADGDSVLAVGAVDTLGQRAGFSSMGPTADGRIKPNVMSVGAGAASCQIPGPGVAWISGTSFSGPIMAGLATCLWQALPARRNMEIFDLLQRCANRQANPDTVHGYGIPNMQLALSLAGYSANTMNDQPQIRIFPQPASVAGPCTLEWESDIPVGDYRITWYSMTGQVIKSQEHVRLFKERNLLPLENKPEAGLYGIGIEGLSYQARIPCLIVP